ncbi:hypothetical protein HY772_09815 [Candidatus Woesearchaeota archaeon]|nr:hypothetical protein [Candidatus Woesearchaeota archaeon]
MPEDKKPSSVDTYKGVIAKTKPEILAHRDRTYGATVAMYDAAKDLNTTSDHDKIVDTMVKAVQTYEKKLKKLPDLGDVGSKYDRGRLISLLQRMGLTEEQMVEANRKGEIDTLFVQLQQQLKRIYTGDLQAHLYNAFGPKGKNRYEMERSLAEGYLKANNSTKPVFEVIKNLEEIIFQEVANDIERAPPKPAEKKAA